jgi:acetyl esterase/lipase
MCCRKEDTTRQLLFLLGIIACLAGPGLPLRADSGYIAENDVVFGRAGDVDLKLDLARPTVGKGPFPAVVFIFGGGWGYYSGDRHQCDNIIQTAASKGYVAVTVDYRLTNVKENGKTKYLFPGQVYDVKCAVRWLRANAEKYDIDSNRIGAVGWSSGGHLALMLGLTDSSDNLEGQCGNAAYSSRVQAVVSMAGLVEAVSFYKNTNVPARVVALLGGAPEEVPEQYRTASPLTYVSKDDPPVLFLQGDRDTSCPPEQAELLMERMRVVGVPCTVIMKKGVGHQSFYGDEEVWSFLADHLFK